MNLKPILFNTDMVRAIQNDTKTVTRRAVKEPYYIDESVLSLKSGFALHRGTAMTDGMPYADQPYLPGEILYVRETFCLNNFGYHYRADWPDDNCPDMSVNDKWRPSIHMPREAARIFLRVTDVWVEQLCYITGKQARTEGFLSRDAFIRAFLTMYPDCTVKSWVWVIEFERCEKPEGA